MSSETEGIAGWHSIATKVLKNPECFDSWQRLVYYAEYEDGHLLDKTLNVELIELLRHSYEAFLRKYPLLTNYWAHYALLEFRFSSKSSAESIFLKGLSFGSYDVTYWVGYLNFKLRTITNNVENILLLFEQARLKIGFQYHSSGFYLLYLAFLRTYANDWNGYNEKYAVLLRSLWDIPLYDCSNVLKESLDLVSPQNLSSKTLAILLCGSEVKEIKTQTKNNIKEISKRLERIVKGAFASSQFRSFRLFQFEKGLGEHLFHSREFLSDEILELWGAYLSFVEAEYPHRYTVQLYERCLIATANYISFVVRYVDFMLHHKKFNAARDILKRYLSLVENQSDVILLVRLIDLELYSGNILRARNLVTNYIKYNARVPVVIFEKLFQIEAVIHSNDSEYLCSLAVEIMHQTNCLSFLTKVMSFLINKNALRELFILFIKPSKINKSQKIGDRLNLRECSSYNYCLTKLFSQNELAEFGLKSS